MRFLGFISKKSSFQRGNSKKTNREKCVFCAKKTGFVFARVVPREGRARSAAPSRPSLKMLNLKWGKGARGARALSSPNLKKSKKVANFLFCKKSLRFLHEVFLTF